MRTEKWRLSSACLSPSSDLAVCASDGRVLRRIEVTSLRRPVDGPEALCCGLAHILRKALAGQDGASHEGCIAVHWAVGAQPRDCLMAVCARLNAPIGWAPIWGQLAQTLDSISFVDHSPTLAPRVWGLLQKRQSGWVLKDELRLERRRVLRRMSTGAVRCLVL